MGEARPQQPILRQGYLPYDIVLNILARLPVKSVIRFSIRMFKRLPDTCLGQLKGVTLGFSYHPENNDYKVVRISCLSLFTHEIEVYTLSSDSWRSVGTTSLTATNVMFYDKNHPLPIPLVNGALHWVSNAVEGEENHWSRMIMAFDVNSERFRELALPDGSVDENTFQRFLALFKGKLALLAWEHREQPGTQYSIWMMKEYGVIESWNKLFVVPFERVAHCIAFTEYGSLLVCYINDQAEVQGFKFVLVDTETLHEKKDPDIQHYSSVATFMESLVLFDGANVVSY
ncbi:F-box protein CPR1-like [Quercus lobata]|uniref:F-box protein CPR1-like n=1 Tax=Quercus lobata TaxID=97700 RepID=UPI0012456543|nr:F-box protein CPR1-like [Quercus lobata]